MPEFPVRSVRPFQLACLVCRAGAEASCEIQERVAGLAEEIAANPDLPLMLRCNIGDLFAFQDPGTDEDTPEGADFNRKRDVDFLQWLDLAPGSIWPARLLLRRLMLRVPSVQGICGYEATAATGTVALRDPWCGCEKAFSGGVRRALRR